MASGDTKGVESLLDRADRWLTPWSSDIATDAPPTPIVVDHDEFARLPAQVAGYRAALALLAGDASGTVAHATRALALAEPADCFAEGNYIPDLLGVSLGLADIQIAQGRLRDARRTYESALQFASSPVARSPCAVHLTAITVAELLYGVARLPQGHRKTDLARLVEAMVSDDFDHRVVPFDEVAAAHYADIVVRRERAGRPISTQDAQIAATCRSHGAILATRNMDDFTDTGITVTNPWDQH